MATLLIDSNPSRTRQLAAKTIHRTDRVQPGLAKRSNRANLEHVRPDIPRSDLARLNDIKPPSADKHTLSRKPLHTIPTTIRHIHITRTTIHSHTTRRSRERRRRELATNRQRRSAAGLAAEIVQNPRSRKRRTSNTTPNNNRHQPSKQNPHHTRHTHKGRTTPPNQRPNSSSTRNPTAPNGKPQPASNRLQNTAANKPHLCWSSPRCCSGVEVHRSAVAGWRTAPASPLTARGCAWRAAFRSPEHHKPVVSDLSRRYLPPPPVGLGKGEQGTAQPVHQAFIGRIEGSPGVATDPGSARCPSSGNAAWTGFRAPEGVWSWYLEFLETAVVSGSGGRGR